MYEERFYRSQISSNFKLEISFKESDLLICSDKQIDKTRAQSLLVKYYSQVERYVKTNPSFQNSLKSIPDDEDAPNIIREMIQASRLSGIGPFSSVAGAIAKYVGAELLMECSEIIIENGGDIFLKINQDKRLGVYLGDNFKGVSNLTLKLHKRKEPFGIASSSALIGHSLNFGKADLLTIVSNNPIIADTFATALSNKIQNTQDAEKILKQAKDMAEIEGILIAFGDKIFIWGDLELSD